MLRITEIKLPLEHPAAVLRAAIVKRLGVADHDLISYSVARRAVDARQPAIAFIYTVDAEVGDEAAFLQRLKDERRISRAPDMSYRFVAHAPAGAARRPS